MTKINYFRNNGACFVLRMRKQKNATQSCYRDNRVRFCPKISVLIFQKLTIYKIVTVLSVFQLYEIYILRLSIVSDARFVLRNIWSCSAIFLTALIDIYLTTE